MLKKFGYVIRIILYSLLIMSAAACQPTPDDKIVQNKNGSDMYRIIGESNGSNQEYDVPTRWEDTFSSNNNDVFININAQIETAGVNEYPVYTIIPHEITNEEAGIILDALIGEENLWAADNGSIVSTKEHMEYIILFFQKQLAQAEDDQAKAELKAMIDYFKIEYEHARKSRYEMPAEKTFSSVKAKQMLNALEFSWKETGTIYGEEGTEEDYLKEKENWLKSINEGENLSIEGIVDLKGDEEAYISIFKNASNKNEFVKYSRYNYLEETLWQYGYKAGKKPELTISREDALKIATETIHDMGIDYMSLVDLDYSGYSNDVHRFTFVRKINGIMTTYAIPQEDLTGRQFREQWQRENLYIEVDDSGIAYLEWRSPTELAEELTPDVRLMPFKDIMNLFNKQILINIVYSGESDSKYIIKREFVINRIVLGSMVIAKPNNLNEYLTVPVWDFFGYEVDTYSSDYPETDGYKLDENNQRKTEMPDHSYITINAIDGSIIDRNLGY